MVSPHIPAGFDFTDPDLYAERLPMQEFAELRRTAPVWWNPTPRGKAGYDDEGYWVVSKHADVKEISRRSEVFSSWENTAITRFNEEMNREQIEMQRLILLNMDPPEHTKLRSIVSRGFTPRAINGLSAALNERAERIVSAAVAGETGDFVTDVACELPLQAIAELLGIPQEHRKDIFDWSNQMIAYDDPEYQIDPTTAATELLGYSMNMAEQRRGCPMDDIVTKLVNADVDGHKLNDDEFGFFVLLLAVAGNETTRNAITHGMHALLEHPEQWELFKAERPATTADEIVRWATPVMSFQRTALADVELRGTPIKQGDRVAMFYSSANFDPEVFDAPERFDVTRDPNPHVGFGGTGAHYCLGANLARLEIDLIFKAIAEQMPGIKKVAEPRRLRSGWLNGIKEFQVRYR
ncbi:cytochrome P450 [Saccharopolyspora gloriosae]|uniref:Cholest-4-en-3-one 26-monooxygenase n=1 Tax=Saccharopolyspora gloriosae TaxID=455344 RepID=A0A840NCL0_9PSEU|nr:cholest-4-en-3-one 26-monooxygenase [Saccharopolyspora gloriosae]